GFTLVEILVVIAILAILTSMLLPAIQSVREAARQTHCKNNLRQLGIAILNYEATTGIYPAGNEHIDGAETETFNDDLVLHSTALRVAPYSEFGHIREIVIQSSRIQGVQRVDLIDHNLPPKVPALPQMNCSSMTTPVRSTNHHQDLPSRVRTDYLPCNGYFDTELERIIKGANYAKKIADIRDGTSNTISFGETMGEVVSGTREYSLPFTFQPGRFINTATDNSDDQNEESVCPQPYLKSFVGKDKNVRNSSRQFSSAHPGQVNFAMCDGSTQAINKSVDDKIMNAIASIDHGGYISFE
ncbi:MAG: DUF1559 domain-containing protein, partial [Planctomycetota bacterium]